jgi:hypothetical protein
MSHADRTDRSMVSVGTRSRTRSPARVTGPKGVDVVHDPIEVEGHRTGIGASRESPMVAIPCRIHGRGRADRGRAGERDRRGRAQTPNLARVNGEPSCGSTDGGWKTIRNFFWAIGRQTAPGKHHGWHVSRWAGNFVHTPFPRTAIHGSSGSWARSSWQGALVYSCPRGGFPLSSHSWR